jgi:c-di-GMP-related signal transduction protein
MIVLVKYPLAQQLEMERLSLLRAFYCSILSVYLYINSKNHIFMIGILLSVVAYKPYRRRLYA